MTDLLDNKESLLSVLGAPSLTGKDKDDFSIVVDSQEIVVESGRVIRTMDTVSDGWTASIRWDSNDYEIMDLLKPFRYTLAECYLGGNIIIKGSISRTKNSISPDKIIKNVIGFSSTVDIIDSNVKPPFEQKKVTLETRATTLLEPFNLSVVFDPDVLLDDEPFDKVTAEPSDKVFAHLAKLASQRGVLITSTKIGELLFTRANIKGKPVGTIAEDFPPGMTFEMDFDGRKRFYEYKAIAKTPGRNKRKKEKLKVASAFDPIIPEYRFMSFQANDVSMGNIQQAADWKRSKTIADAMTIPFPVSGWYDPDGDLWDVNTLVTVKSPLLHIPDGFNFLIKSVEYRFQSSGTTAILGLVPPQAFTGAEITEPWGVPEKGFLERLL